MRTGVVDYYPAQLSHLSYKYQQLAMLEKQLAYQDRINRHLQMQLSRKWDDDVIKYSRRTDISTASKANHASRVKRISECPSAVKVSTGPQGRDGLDYLRAHQFKGQWRGKNKTETGCKDFVKPSYHQLKIKQVAMQQRGPSKDVYMSPRHVSHDVRPQTARIVQVPIQSQAQPQAYVIHNRKVPTEESRQEPIYVSAVSAAVPLHQTGQNHQRNAVSQLYEPNHTQVTKNKKMFLSVVSESRKSKKITK